MTFINIKEIETNLQIPSDQHEPHPQTKQSADSATCQAHNNQKIAATMLGLFISLTDSGIYASLDEISAMVNNSREKLSIEMNPKTDRSRRCTTRTKPRDSSQLCLRTLVPGDYV